MVELIPEVLRLSLASIVSLVRIVFSICNYGVPYVGGGAQLDLPHDSIVAMDTILHTQSSS